MVSMYMLKMPSATDEHGQDAMMVLPGITVAKMQGWYSHTPRIFDYLQYDVLENGYASRDTGKVPPICLTEASCETHRSSRSRDRPRTGSIAHG